MAERRFQFPEGATPLNDMSGLKLLWVHHLKDLNRVEAENIANAQKKYMGKSVDHPTQWFNPTFFRKIHVAMFGDVWDWAGSWRRSTTNIGIKPQYIPMRLSEFCAEVIYWGQGQTVMTYLEKAARIHHRLVSIHPFENGNGRFSRLIADRYLLAHKCVHPIWPSYLGVNGEIRDLYISCLKAADQGDYFPLVQLMQEFHAKESNN